MLARPLSTASLSFDRAQYFLSPRRRMKSAEVHQQRHLGRREFDRRQLLFEGGRVIVDDRGTVGRQGYVDGSSVLKNGIGYTSNELNQPFQSPVVEQERAVLGLACPSDAHGYFEPLASDNRRHALQKSRLDSLRLHIGCQSTDRADLDFNDLRRRDEQVRGANSLLGTFRLRDQVQLGMTQQIRTGLDLCVR